MAADAEAKQSVSSKAPCAEPPAPKRKEQWGTIVLYLIAQGIVAYFVVHDWGKTQVVLALLFLSFVITQVAADYTEFTVPWLKRVLTSACSLIPAIAAVFAASL